MALSMHVTYGNDIPDDCSCYNANTPDGYCYRRGCAAGDDDGPNCGRGYQYLAPDTLSPCVCPGYYTGTPNPTANGTDFDNIGPAYFDSCDDYGAAYAADYSDDNPDSANYAGVAQNNAAACCYACCNGGGNGD